MVCKMVLASKLLGVFGVFMMAKYAAVYGRCLKALVPTAPTAPMAPTTPTATMAPTTPTSTTEEQPPCPPTWSQWQDKCYKVSGYATWEEGKQICIEMDGVIAIPQSYEELQHLHSMCSCSWVLIGCSDIEVEGTWVCLDGKGIDVDDERWDQGEPDSRGGENEDCPAGYYTGWHDRDCSDPLQLICQRPISSAL